MYTILMFNINSVQALIQITDTKLTTDKASYKHAFLSNKNRGRCFKVYICITQYIKLQAITGFTA